MTSADIWTIGRILTWSIDYLKDKGQTDSPRLDAEVLLSHATGLSRVQLYTNFDKPLTSQERDPFRQCLIRRSKGEPVAYIIGERDFMGLTFHVSPAVLIPRPDTEILVEKALQSIATLESPKILDVGTGSGCIAISLATLRSDASVSAWDINQAALAVAQANAERHSQTLTFTQCDATEEAPWQALARIGNIDLVISNPPYIHPDEAVGPGVRQFEPHQALFAPPDGLIFYQALATHAHLVLNPGGVLACEIGYTQKNAVTEIFLAQGWQDIRVFQDYGKQDRVIIANKPR